MPGLNGKQCLIKLKKMPALKNIPVIVNSTSIDIHGRRNLMDLGAFYFLVKSFSYQKPEEELSLITADLIKG